MNRKKVIHQLRDQWSRCNQFVFSCSPSPVRFVRNVISKSCLEVKKLTWEEVLVGGDKDIDSWSLKPTTFSVYIFDHKQEPPPPSSPYGEAGKGKGYTRTGSWFELQKTSCIPLAFPFVVPPFRGILQLFPVSWYTWTSFLIFLSSSIGSSLNKAKRYDRLACLGYTELQFLPSSDHLIQR